MIEVMLNLATQKVIPIMKETSTILLSVIMPQMTTRTDNENIHNKDTTDWFSYRDSFSDNETN